MEKSYKCPTCGQKEGENIYKCVINGVTYCSLCLPVRCQNKHNNDALLGQECKCLIAKPVQ